MTGTFGSARLHSYVALAAVGLGGALATGRPELAALAAPFAVALVAGIAAASPARIRAAIVADPDRVIEGETLTITVMLEADTDTAPVEILLAVAPGLELVDPPGAAAWSVALRAYEPRSLTATVVATKWGRYDCGRIAVRVRPALGLLVWEWRMRLPTTVRVLPDTGTLRRILRPFDTRSDSGHQVARTRGEGIEFADVRPFRPGDRAGRVNWRVSARRGEAYVNDQHPERNADAVLLIDTFADTPGGGSPTLDRAVRAACSLSTAMLEARDRVGVVSLGGSTDWITPGMGERAHWVIVEHLLASTARWTEAERSLRWLPPAVLPPRTLVVVLSPLVDDRMLSAVIDLRRRGFDVTVIVLEAELPEALVRSTAGRLWSMERAARRHTLEALGVRLAAFESDDPLPVVIAQLDRARVRVGTARR